MSVKKYQSPQSDQQIDQPFVSKFKTFSLDKEEPFRFTFYHQDIKLQPQQILFDDESSQIQNQIREEILQYNNRVHSNQPSSQKGSLDEQYQMVKDLISDFRFIEQVILATSKQSIYSYGVGFDSQGEEAEENQDSVNYEIGRRIDGTGNRQERLWQIPNLLQINPQNTELKHTMLQSIFQQENAPDEKHKLLITFPNEQFSQLNKNKLAKKVKILKACFQKKISKDEKKRFLTLFQKILALKRGIAMKMNESKGDQHVCKICDLKFQTGRKLGGHVSRKHPGNVSQYSIKKEVLITKMCQKNRRDYFKLRKRKSKVAKKQSAEQRQNNK